MIYKQDCAVNTESKNNLYVVELNNYFLDYVTKMGLVNKSCKVIIINVLSTSIKELIK